MATVDLAFAQAIEENNLEALKALLADPHVDVDTQDSFGNSALHHAAQHSCLEACRLIVDAHANVDVTNDEGTTPLQYAVFYDNLDCVDLLLGAKASPDLEDSDGTTPLALAAAMGSMDCTRLLLAAGANGPRALRQCIRQDESDGVLDTLLLAGVDPSEECPSGCSLLAWAARSGRADAVDWLLDADADPDGSDRHGTSAVTLAVDNDEYDLAHALVAAGATIDPCSTTNQRLFGWRRLTPAADSLQAGVTHAPPLSLGSLSDDLISHILDSASLIPLASIALASKGWHERAVQAVLRPLVWERQVEEHSWLDENNASQNMLCAVACRMSPSDLADFVAMIMQLEVVMENGLCSYVIAKAAENTLVRGAWTPEMLMKVTLPIVDVVCVESASYSAYDVKHIARSVKLDDPCSYAKLVPAALEKAGSNTEPKAWFLMNLFGQFWEDLDFSVDAAEKLAELTVRLALPVTDLIAVATKLRDEQHEFGLEISPDAYRDNPDSWVLALLQGAVAPPTLQCPWSTEDTSTCVMAIAPDMITSYFAREASEFSHEGASALSRKLGTLAGSVSLATSLSLFRTMAQQEAAWQQRAQNELTENGGQGDIYRLDLYSSRFEYTRLFLHHFGEAASSGTSSPRSWSEADGVLFIEEIARQIVAVRVAVAPVVLGWVFQLHDPRPQLAASLFEATTFWRSPVA